MGKTELWQWDAVDLAKAIRLRKISSHEATEGVPRSPRRGEPEAQRRHVPDRRAGAARRRGRRCGGESRRGAWPAARRAGQHQGEYRPEGPADAQRRGRLQGRDRAGRLTGRRELAQGRRRLHRPHQCAGLLAALGHRQRAARPHLQSVGQGAHAGRLLRRRRRRRSPPASGRSPTATTTADRSAIPAYCCGVAGIRPTHGPRAAFNPSAQAERPPTFAMFAVQGPLARRVKDVRLGLHAMSGRDARDPWWVPAHHHGRSPQRPIKVGLITEAPGSTSIRRSPKRCAKPA